MKGNWIDRDHLIQGRVENDPVRIAAQCETAQTGILVTFEDYLDLQRALEQAKKTAGETYHALREEEAYRAGVFACEKLFLAWYQQQTDPGKKDITDCPARKKEPVNLDAWFKQKIEENDGFGYTMPQTAAKEAYENGWRLLGQIRNQTCTKWEALQELRQKIEENRGFGYTMPQTTVKQVYEEIWGMISQNFL